MEKLPPKNGTIAISGSDPNDNIELAINPEMSELEYMMAARNAKTYFVFASCVALAALAFSITSLSSCSFAVVNWGVDGDVAAQYQATVTDVGLFRWYNHGTSSCWAYSPYDTNFFYVDRTARILALAAVVFGGCAAWIFATISLFNLIGCGRNKDDAEGGGSGNFCSKFNLNSTNNSITFFVLSGLTFLASILQICTLTYFSPGTVTDYSVICNAKGSDSNCTMGVGAHYAIIAFVFYLIACFVYAMAGVGCRVIENQRKSPHNDVPPPPPPFPPQSMQRLGGEGEFDDLGSEPSSYYAAPPAPPQGHVGIHMGRDASTVAPPPPPQGHVGVLMGREGSSVAPPAPPQGYNGIHYGGGGDDDVESV